MKEFCIASKATSIYWYEHRITINLIEELEKLGCKYIKNSTNRIYLLGHPIVDKYKEVGKFDKEANNIALSISHPERCKSFDGFSKVFLASEGMQHYYLKKFNVRYEMLPPFSSLNPCNIVDDFYKCDIAFIGNIRKRQIVEDVLDIVEKHKLNFKIFGYNWKDYQGDKRAIKYWTGDVIPYQHFPILAHNASIVLIDHHQSMNDIGVVSHKYIDLVKADAYVISDYNKNAIQYAGIVYKNQKELETHILFRLNNPKLKSGQYNWVRELTTGNAAKTLESHFK